MNKNVKFTLKFAAEEKSLLVVFNPNATEKQVQHIGMNGQGFKSVSMLNAIGELINKVGCDFQIRDAGMYLHRSFEEAGQKIEDPNIGYVTGSVLLDLLKADEVSFRGDVSKGEVYRLMSNALGIHGALVTVKEYVKGEHPAIKHNRSAYYKVLNLETLRLAEEKGVNLKLWYQEKQAPRFDLMLKHWNMFLDGKFEDLAVDIQIHIDNATAKKESYKKEGYFASLAAEGKARVAEGVVVVVDKGETDVNELVGTWVQYVTAKGVVLPQKYEITDVNVASRVAIIKARKYQVVFCSPLETVTELVSEHHNAKARAERKTKVAA